MKAATTHINSDIDALASLVALYLLEGPLEIVLPGAMDPTARQLWEDLAGQRPELTTIRRFLQDSEAMSRGTLHVVDTADPARLGPLQTVVGRFQRVIAWDTHPAAEGEFERAPLTPAAACISSLVLILAERGIRPSSSEAGLFLVGIHEDTGHFTFPETTTADHRAASLCLDWGADPRWPEKYIPRGLNSRQLALLEQMSHGVQVLPVGGGSAAIMTLELDHYEPQLSTLVGQLQGAEDWSAAFLVAALQGRIYVIGRGDGSFDVAQVLKRIGGGGHAGAASGTLSGVSLAGAVAVLRQSIDEQCERHTTAGELAVRRFARIAADRTIRDAADAMHRHRVNALPLTRGPEEAPDYVGLVSRQEVDAAQRHGLGERPVAEISAGPPPWVASDASLAAARARMLAGGGRLLLVGNPGRPPVGILTRTAVLRAGSENGPLAPRRRVPNPRVLLEMARKTLESSWPLIESIGNLAEELDMSLHLVGGCVRDVLLGGQVRDIDLVVEGDAPELARTVARKLGGRVHVHAPFATARYVTEAGLSLDLATARSEYYESPASLPRILHSELRRDLFRRDFTINAMAIAVGSADAGLLRDPFNGFDDLKNRRLRVLHGLSFHDDPTRAWRAARFAARFDFRLAPNSDGLLRAALRSGVFDRLGLERLGHEIDAILDEREVDQALRLLRDWNLLGQIHPRFAADRAFLERITAVQNSRHEIRGIRGPGELAAAPSQSDALWIVIASAVPEPDRATLARMVPGSRERRLSWRDGPRRVANAVARIEQSSQRSDWAAALSPLDLAERIVVLGSSPSRDVRRAVRWWEREGRSIRTTVNGRTLLSLGIAPGPDLGRALAAAQTAAWDGAGDDEQLAAARGALPGGDAAPRG